MTALSGLSKSFLCGAVLVSAFAVSSVFPSRALAQCSDCFNEGGGGGGGGGNEGGGNEGGGNQGGANQGGGNEGGGYQKKKPGWSDVLKGVGDAIVKQQQEKARRDAERREEIRKNKAARDAQRKEKAARRAEQKRREKAERDRKRREAEAERKRKQKQAEKAERDRKRKQAEQAERDRKRRQAEADRKAKEDAADAADDNAADDNAADDEEKADAAPVCEGLICAEGEYMDGDCRCLKGREPTIDFTSLDGEPITVVVGPSGDFPAPSDLSDLICQLKIGNTTIYCGGYLPGLPPTRASCKGRLENGCYLRPVSVPKLDGERGTACMQFCKTKPPPIITKVKQTPTPKTPVVAKTPGKPKTPAVKTALATPYVEPKPGPTPAVKTATATPYVQPKPGPTPAVKTATAATYVEPAPRP